MSQCHPLSKVCRVCFRVLDGLFCIYVHKLFPSKILGPYNTALGTLRLNPNFGISAFSTPLVTSWYWFLVNCVRERQYLMIAIHLSWYKIVASNRVSGACLMRPAKVLSSSILYFSSVSSFLFRLHLNPCILSSSQDSTLLMTLEVLYVLSFIVISPGKLSILPRVSSPFSSFHPM